MLDALATWIPSMLLGSGLLGCAAAVVALCLEDLAPRGPGPGALSP